MLTMGGSRPSIPSPLQSEHPYGVVLTPSTEQFSQLL